MKIMNRNLTGKLQELHGIQYEDTHVALTEIRGQLHQLTQRLVSYSDSLLVMFCSPSAWSPARVRCVRSRGT